MRSSEFRAIQVAQQRGERRVEDLARAPVDLVVIDMSIPTAERDLDAAHADLDQPARGEAAAAERRIAVLGGDARGLLRDVECLELLGGHHHAGTGERLAVQGRLDAAAGRGRRPVRATSRSRTRAMLARAGTPAR